MTELTQITTGLQFPEGPVALDDGGVLVVELARGALSRVHPDGRIDLVADCGGSPEWCRLRARRPGVSSATTVGSSRSPTSRESAATHARSRRTSGGMIQAVDLDTGDVETLYTECDGRSAHRTKRLGLRRRRWLLLHRSRCRGRQHRLAWGALRQGGRFVHRGAGATVLSRPMASVCRRTAGTSTSPRRTTASCSSGRLSRPARSSTSVAADGPHGGRLLHKAPDGQLFDSLAVDAEGWVNVATLVNGGITSVSPSGTEVIHTPVPDVRSPPTSALVVTGWVRRSSPRRPAGSLYRTPWARNGLDLAY